MSLSYWKGLGSPELSKSVTMLTAFYGRSFRPQGILPSIKVHLGGKTIAIEVEVVDATLDYNLLLGRRWMYNMQAIASSLFRVVCFQHNRKIVMIDQTSSKNPSVAASSGASIPIVEHSQPAIGSVGVGMYPSLMGSFSCPAPILMIGSSSDEALTSTTSVSFRTSHMEDPWILPTLGTSSEPIEMSVPFPVAMIAYQANLKSVAEPCYSSSRTEEEDPYVLPAWEV